MTPSPSPKSSAGRPRVQCYLAVPFAEKDAAKALGARWDPARKKWYVPQGTELAPFAQWLSPDATPAAGAESIREPVLPPGFVAYDGETPPWE
ncbi:DUF5710 domain-containing protein [Jeongeupia wiesaeckerbachi]|uniref:DUF5710 domain-containing protein n=1 Tax=Jeongeupia wiesaeckerbachi TaxID=3051218 RepID=UPI003D808243